MLHLSDLHLSDASQVDEWYGQLTEDLRQLACDHLDALVLSGVLTNTSNPSEYAAVRSFLNKLRRDFHLSRERAQSGDGLGGITCGGAAGLTRARAPCPWRWTKRGPRMAPYEPRRATRAAAVRSSQSMACPQSVGPPAPTRGRARKAREYGGLHRELRESAQAAEAAPLTPATVVYRLYAPGVAALAPLFAVCVGAEQAGRRRRTEPRRRGAACEAG